MLRSIVQQAFKGQLARGYYVSKSKYADLGETVVLTLLSLVWLARDWSIVWEGDSERSILTDGRVSQLLS